MDWQQISALTIVGATVAAFAWARFKRPKFSFERDTHCGCSAADNSNQKQSIVFHARRGQRPEVIVKMK